MADLAKIIIRVPKGFTGDALSIDALTALVRDKAFDTTIEAESGLLLCRSFKKSTRNGKNIILLEVMEECFEIVEKH